MSSKIGELYYTIGFEDGSLSQFYADLQRISDALEETGREVERNVDFIDGAFSTMLSKIGDLRELASAYDSVSRSMVDAGKAYNDLASAAPPEVPSSAAGPAGLVELRDIRESISNLREELSGGTIVGALNTVIETTNRAVDSVTSLAERLGEVRQEAVRAAAGGGAGLNDVFDNLVAISQNLTSRLRLLDRQLADNQITQQEYLSGINALVQPLDALGRSFESQRDYILGSGVTLTNYNTELARAVDASLRAREAVEDTNTSYANFIPEGQRVAAAIASIEGEFRELFEMQRSGDGAMSEYRSNLGNLTARLNEQRLVLQQLIQQNTGNEEAVSKLNTTLGRSAGLLGRMSRSVDVLTASSGGSNSAFTELAATTRMLAQESDTLVKRIRNFEDGTGELRSELRSLSNSLRENLREMESHESQMAESVAGAELWTRTTNTLRRQVSDLDVVLADSSEGKYDASVRRVVQSSEAFIDRLRALRTVVPQNSLEVSTLSDAYGRLLSDLMGTAGGADGLLRSVRALQDQYGRNSVAGRQLADVLNVLRRAHKGIGEEQNALRNSTLAVNDEFSSVMDKAQQLMLQMNNLRSSLRIAQDSDIERIVKEMNDLQKQITETTLKLEGYKGQTRITDQVEKQRLKTVTDLNNATRLSEAAIAKTTSALNGMAKSSQLSATLAALLGQQIFQMSPALGILSGRIQNNTESFGDWLDATSKIVIIGGAIIGFFSLLRSSIEAIRELETAQVDVQKTTNFTKEEVESLTRSFQTLSREIPMSSIELLKVAAVAGQLGITGLSNINTFTVALSKLAIATDVVGEEGAEQLARFLTATGTSMELMGAAAEVTGNVLNELENTTAASAAQILSMTKYTQGLASTINASRAQILGINAAFLSMGMTAEGSGGAIVRVMARIQAAVAKGGEELAQFAKAASMTTEEFAELVRTSPLDALIAITEQLGKASDVSGELRKMGIVNTRDVRLMSILASNTQQFVDVLQRANDETFTLTSLNEEVSKRIETLDSRVKMLNNRLLNLRQSATFLEKPLKVIFDVLNFLVDNIEATIIAVSSLITAWAGFAAVAAAAKVAALGLAAVVAAVAPLVAVGVIGLTAFGLGLYGLFTRAKDTTKSIEELNTELEKSAAILSEVRSADQLVSALEKISDFLTGEAKEAWNAYAESVKDGKNEIKDYAKEAETAFIRLANIQRATLATRVESAVTSARTAAQEVVGYSDVRGRLTAGQMAEVLTGRELNFSDISELVEQINAIQRVTSRVNPFDVLDEQLAGATWALQRNNPFRLVVDELRVAQEELDSFNQRYDQIMQSLATNPPPGDDDDDSAIARAERNPVEEILRQLRARNASLRVQLEREGLGEEQYRAGLVAAAEAARDGLRDIFTDLGNPDEIRRQAQAAYSAVLGSLPALSLDAARAVIDNYATGVQSSLGKVRESGDLLGRTIGDSLTNQKSVIDAAINELVTVWQSLTPEQQENLRESFASALSGLVEESEQVGMEAAAAIRNATLGAGLDLLDWQRQRDETLETANYIQARLKLLDEARLDAVKNQDEAAFLTLNRSVRGTEALLRLENARVRFGEQMNRINEDFAAGRITESRLVQQQLDAAEAYNAATADTLSDQELMQGIVAENVGMMRGVASFAILAAEAAATEAANVRATAEERRKVAEINERLADLDAERTRANFTAAQQMQTLNGKESDFMRARLAAQERYVNALIDANATYPGRAVLVNLLAREAALLANIRSELEQTNRIEALRAAEVAQTVITERRQFDARYSSVAELTDLIQEQTREYDRLVNLAADATDLEVERRNELLKTIKRNEDLLAVTQARVDFQEKISGFDLNTSVGAEDAVKAFDILNARLQELALRGNEYAAGMLPAWARVGESLRAAFGDLRLDELLQLDPVDDSISSLRGLVDSLSAAFDALREAGVNVDFGPLSRRIEALKRQLADREFRQAVADTFVERASAVDSARGLRGVLGIERSLEMEVAAVERQINELINLFEDANLQDRVSLESAIAAQQKNLERIKGDLASVRRERLLEEAAQAEINQVRQAEASRDVLGNLPTEEAILAAMRGRLGVLNAQNDAQGSLNELLAEQLRIVGEQEILVAQVRRDDEIANAERLLNTTMDQAEAFQEQIRAQEALLNIIENNAYASDELLRLEKMRLNVLSAEETVLRNLGLERFKQLRGVIANVVEATDGVKDFVSALVALTEEGIVTEDTLEVLKALLGEFPPALQSVVDAFTLAQRTIQNEVARGGLVADSEEYYKRQIDVLEDFAEKLRQVDVDDPRIVEMLEFILAEIERITALMETPAVKLASLFNKMGDAFGKVDTPAAKAAEAVSRAAAAIADGYTKIAEALKTMAEDATAGKEQLFAAVAGILGALGSVGPQQTSEINKTFEATLEIVGAVVDMIPALKGWGKVVAQAGKVLSNVLGDMGNGLKEIAKIVSETANSSKLLSKTLIEGFAKENTERVKRKGLLGLFGFTKAQLSESFNEIVSIAEGLAGGIRDALAQGIRDGLSGTKGWRENMHKAIRDTVVSALVDAFVKSAILNGMLDEFLKTFSKMLQEGDIEGGMRYAERTLPELLRGVDSAADRFIEMIQRAAPDLAPNAGRGGGGATISEITGPTRDLLIDLLRPLSILPSWTTMIRDIRNDVRKMADGNYITTPPAINSANGLMPTMANAQGAVVYNLSNVTINSSADNIADLAKELARYTYTERRGGK
jgi:TP901 family phage tail tape measure protein